MREGRRFLNGQAGSESGYGDGYRGARRHHGRGDGQGVGPYVFSRFLYQGYLLLLEN